MDTIHFQCPTCSSKYQVKAELAGKRIRCRDCDETCRVPDTRVTSKPKPASSAESKAVLVLFSCPACGAGYEAERKYVGETMECEECHEEFEVVEKAPPSSGGQIGTDSNGTSPQGPSENRANQKLPVFLAIAGGLAVLVALVGIYLERPPASKLTTENFLKVQRGMTMADVELILGKPDTRLSDSMSGLWTYRKWPVEIDIVFNGDGVVVSKRQYGLE